MIFEPKRFPEQTELADACGAPARGRPSFQNSAEAEDNFQAACMRLLQIGANKAVKNPTGYLRCVIRNLFINGSRRRSRESQIFQHTDDVSLFIDDWPNPEQFLANKQILIRAFAEIERLPPRCREAFTLHRFENLSYSIIARRMGINVSMVEKHIADAMTRLVKARNADESLA